MLILAAKFCKLFRKFFIIGFLENIFETSVIFLENCVLRRQIDRPFALQAIVEDRARKITDRGVKIIHAHRNTGFGEVKDFALDSLAIFAFPLHRQLAFAWDEEICCFILVTKGVTANNDWLCPTRHEARDVVTDDRFAENYTAKDVADGAIWRLPHFLKVEFFDALLIGCDGRAFDADIMFFNRFSCINCDLIIRCIAGLDRQIIVEQIDVEVWVD